MNLRWKGFIFIVVPTLLVGCYYFFIATDMYISESHFAIRSAEGGTSSALLTLLGHVGTGVGADAKIVEDYILSSGLLKSLEQQFSLEKHYQNPQADFFSRLKANPTQEEFFKYYQKVVNVRFDAATGVITLEVRAFEPEFAQAVNVGILRRSEKLVNDLGDRAKQDFLSLARSELKKAEQRLSVARQEMKKARQETQLLDPKAAAGAILSLITQLESEAVKARTELAEARSYMQEDSSTVVTLKSRVKALDEQIQLEQSRLTGQDESDLSAVAGRFEELTVEHEFAQQQYVSAMSSLESARVRAEVRSRYLVDFVAPTLPQEPMWPRRGRNVIIALALCTLIFAIVSLIVAAIRDHVGR